PVVVGGTGDPVADRLDDGRTLCRRYRQAPDGPVEVACERQNVAYLAPEDGGGGGLQQRDVAERRQQVDQRLHPRRDGRAEAFEAKRGHSATTAREAAHAEGPGGVGGKVRGPGDVVRAAERHVHRGDGLRVVETVHDQRARLLRRGEDLDRDAAHDRERAVGARQQLAEIVAGHV